MGIRFGGLVCARHWKIWTSDIAHSPTRETEKENKELRQELRFLQQESRQYRQRSYSRSR